MELTKKSYENPSSVGFYSKEIELHPAEKTLFKRHENELKSSKFLDIGIGAGRTTIYLANNVAEYVCVDYSQKMIDYCKSKFTKLNAEFLCCDARKMDMFPDESFDFVFFSFNGIDCVNIEDRKLILEECFRILIKGGGLLFSSHNTKYQSNLKSYSIGLNPVNTFKEIRRYRYRNLHNDWNKISNEDPYFYFNDLDYNDPIQLVYIQPNHQIGMLKEVGFNEIQCHAKSDAKILSGNNLDKYEEAWTYYFCRKTLD